MTEYRKLIEEARDFLADKNPPFMVGHIHQEDLLALLTEALTLLPEWQEFDAKREETWPCDEKSEAWRNWIVCNPIGWVSMESFCLEMWKFKEISHHQPLPPPYVKK